MKKLYIVERLVVEYQYIAADTEEEAIEDALDCGEWDRETIGQGDELAKCLVYSYLIHTVLH